MKKAKCPKCNDTKKTYDQLHFKTVPCICQASQEVQEQVRRVNQKVLDWHKAQKENLS